MNKPLQIALTLLLCGMIGRAQSPADWWFFGINAGVHFTSSGPVADTNGQLNTNEGCASISDNQGNLMFYTDGSTVWNEQHNVMPNGTGLLGNASSSQSAIIVPDPGSQQRYYIITVPVIPDTGMRYTAVDMTLDGGLGDIVTTEKNILLIRQTGENVCAVKNSTGNGLWIVTHLLYGDTVAAFHITGGGVNTTPVISLAGDSIWARVGSIKGAPNAEMICFGSQLTGGGRIKLMQFNNGTGQVEDVISWSSAEATGPYGVEFSPNSEVLYISDGWGGTDRSLVQYDVSVFDSATIVSSEYELIDSFSFGQIQLGPDERIYISTGYSGFFPGADSFLHRINEPNVLGAGCDLELNAVFLDGRKTRMGLPPFLSSFFNVDFDVVGICFGEATQFIPDTIEVDSFQWDFGDPSTGSQNTSTLPLPTHVFSDSGWFSVTLIATRDTFVDTTVSLIYIYPQPFLDLGNDTVLCVNDTLNLNIEQPHAQFLWHDGSTLDSMIIYSDSLVSVTVFGQCDTLSDTLQVVFDSPLTIDLGPDTLICEEQYVLNPGLGSGVTYAWSTGDSIDSIAPTESGTYALTATNACGSESDSVEITVRPVPGDSLLPADTINCFNNAIVLTRPSQDSVTYIWSDSTSKKNYTVDTTETVWLAAFNECGISVDTIDIIFNGEILSELGEDTNICEGDSILLIATHPGASYVWNTGDTTDTAWTDQVESFNYVVTVTYKACQTIESKRVDMDDFFCDPIDCKLEYPNVFSPNGDGINDIFRAWSDCDIYSYSLYVYNRWGQLVHFDAHASFGWDGSSNGQPAPPGVYYFVIDFLDNVVVDEDRKAYSGSFTLIR